MQDKQVHHGGIIFIKRFLHEFCCSQYLSTYKQKGAKVFLLSNALHPCLRCPTRCDHGQKNQLALSRKLGICINSVKQEKLVRYTQILEKFFPGNFGTICPRFENFDTKKFVLHSLRSALTQSSARALYFISRQTCLSGGNPLCWKIYCQSSKLIPGIAIPRINSASGNPFLFLVQLFLE